MPQDPNRTFHANQALELSELINLQFARIRYGATDPHLVRMREPDGPSTDAGRKARQPLVLIRDAEDESGVVFGFVDLFRRTADLRGYTVVRQQYEKRFASAFPLTRNDYGRMIEELKAFLESQAFQTRVLYGGSAPGSPGQPPTQLASGDLNAASSLRRTGQGSPYGLMLVSAAIGFASCYLLWVLKVLPL